MGERFDWKKGREFPWKAGLGRDGDITEGNLGKPIDSTKDPKEIKKEKLAAAGIIEEPLQKQ